MHKRSLPVVVGLVLLSAGAAEPNPYQDAARELDRTISTNYAYLDDLPGGLLPASAELERRRESVFDADTLLRYAAARIASLSDHHAITGSSFRDSWALVPTYADLWLVKKDGRIVVDAVRAESPASAAGIAVGDKIVGVGGRPVEEAIEAFWSNMGLSLTPSREEYAARVLLAGRRDRVRRFVIENASGDLRQVNLPSLYDVASPTVPALQSCSVGNRSIIRFNNSLGNSATIEEFDEAMRQIPEANELVLDLRDTPSGGNTTVARAIMGWFVREARAYQVHDRPSEQRVTGIARQWIEQVLPRESNYRATLPTVIVGRWTGSMGEGLAIGFHALGAEVVGTPMAGLKGSVEDLSFGDTDLVVKLPTERLFTVNGLPREEFVPERAGYESPLLDGCR